MVQSQTDRQKAMYRSPPCISTGVLKKLDVTVLEMNIIPISSTIKNIRKTSPVIMSNVVSLDVSYFKVLCGKSDHVVCIEEVR